MTYTFDCCNKLNQMCSIINLKVFQGLPASFPEMVFLVSMLRFVFDILE